MIRFEIRWMRRHPLMWLRIVWWHAGVMVLLIFKGALVTHPVWDLTPGDPFWPLMFGVAAGVVGLSAVAPLDKRLQNVAMWTLLFVSVTRAVAYVLVVLAVDLTSTTAALAAAFVIHWTVIALVALRWPLLSTIAGSNLTASASRDDRGRR